MAINNNINFANLTAKSTPTTSDLLEISDQAASGIPKQTPISDLPALPVQQVSQFNPSGGTVFSCSLPGMTGTTQSDSLTQTMGTLLNSNVVFTPFFVPVSWSATKLSIVIKTGLAASTVTMGIYASSSSGSFQNLPVGSALTAASMATGTATTNTLVSATISATLSANTLYWAAFQASSAVTLSICVGALNFGPWFTYINVAQTAFTSNVLTYSNAYSAGSLPTLTQSSLSLLNRSLYFPIINGQ